MHPRVLVVTHHLGGGVERYVQDLLALLHGHAELEVLRPLGATQLQWSLQMPGSAPLPLAAQDWCALTEVLRARRYDWVNFQHVQGFAATVVHLADDLGLPYDVTLHDYLPYCPQLNLVAEDGSYCGEPDSAGCADCLRRRPPAWDWDIGSWREHMRDWLGAARRVLVPSHHLAQRVRHHFPNLTIEVCPHPPRHEWLESTPPVRKVLLLGKLTRAKGLTTLLACASYARERHLPLHFCVLGAVEHAWDPTLPITVRGEYDDADATALLALERADCIWYPGTYPETWGYTLDLALRSGLPIVATDFGAVAERLQGHPQAHLQPVATGPDAWCTALVRWAGEHIAPVSLQNPSVDDQSAREAYRLRWLAALPPADHTGNPGVPLLEGIAGTMRPAAPPPLPALFEHGVVCGHREAREALRLRLDEVEHDLAVLHDQAARLGRPWYELTQAATELTEQLEMLQKTQRALQEQCASQTEVIQKLQSDVERSSDAIAERDAQLQKREAEVQALRTSVESLHGDVRVFQGHVNRANARIQELEHSTSWRVTAPMRWVSYGVRGAARQVRRVAAFAGYARGRLPIALGILRSEGAGALLQRVRRKYGWNRAYLPPAATPVASALPDIGPLTLVTCPETAVPEVSIVIAAYGQDAYTFQCLQSLAQHTDLGRVEVIVVDDASPEPVARGLSRVAGVRFLRAERNGGFIASCHLGADAARGTWLLMLNNDVQVCAGWLPALQEVFAQRDDAGLVGARLVYPDGRLQEAGGIIWQDGSAWNWGRGGDPEHPQVRYLRAADYCSGACLLMRKADWDTLGGFDRHYAPAYYEDTDLAMRVRQHLGKRVYYQPAAVIIHHEGVSSGTDETQGIKRHQVINRDKFFERWQVALHGHRVNGVLPRLEVNRAARARVLVVEACMITPDQDSGSVRMLAMLELLLELGCAVSFVADNLEHRQPYVEQLQRRGVEVWHHPYVQSVEKLIEEHGAEFDAVVLCRHYIAVKYVAVLRTHAPQARVIFDTVDLHYLREQRLADLDGSASVRAAAEKTRAQELGVIRAVDLTWVVSPVEQGLLANEAPGARVDILSNIHALRDSGCGFAERDGLIFVGGFRHPPNIDAVLWFLQQVWPLVLQQNPDLRVTIVGSNMPVSIRDLRAPNLTVAGFVEDVDALLDAARISIAPLRYGAGVKGKINQAMACGLPVVATTPAVEGMGLQDGEELLVADTPQAFADAVVRLHTDAALWDRLAVGGRENVSRHFSREEAKAALARAILPQPQGDKW